MQTIIIITFLLISWIVWSKFIVTKEIEITLNKVSNNQVVASYVPVEEFVNYALSHDLEAYLINNKAVIHYKNRVIEIIDQQKKSIASIKNIVIP